MKYLFAPKWNDYCAHLKCQCAQIVAPHLVNVWVLGTIQHLWIILHLLLLSTFKNKNEDSRMSEGISCRFYWNFNPFNICKRLSGSTYDGILLCFGSQVSESGFWEPLVSYSSITMDLWLLCLALARSKLAKHMVARNIKNYYKLIFNGYYLNFYLCFAELTFRWFLKRVPLFGFSTMMTYFTCLQMVTPVVMLHRLRQFTLIYKAK